MPKLHRILPGAIALGLLSVWLLSCSKNSTSPAPITTPAGPLNGNLGAGTTYNFTFTTAGTFNYHCAIHPSCSSLAGTIVVIPVGGTTSHRVLGITQSGGSSDPYGPICATVSPQRDTVFVGDTVTWTNSSPLPHTVTSQ